MTVRHMTAEELFQYRNEPYRQELVEGILHEMEPPGAEHGLVGTRFGLLLATHVDRHALGVAFLSEVGFELASDPDTVLGPDLSFVARERIPAEGVPKAYWPGPPDLAVEVVSPHDRRPAVRRKAELWIASGTAVALVLDPPTRTATIHRPGADPQVRSGEDALDLGDVLPGFAPIVGPLFA